ncbi:hypothetical protein [Deinococcus altitudinis]|uniref:hypothetical protein n=1 Tax=Deinococcus altitudinis TaxID=468914 RepID=UPI0038923603
MSRPLKPDTTLERGINRVLSSIAPLTAGQIVRALNPTDPMVVYNTLYRLYKRGTLGRVASSPIQRQISRGRGNAYALVAR